MANREEMTRTAFRDHGKSVVCVVIHKKVKVGRKMEDEALAASGFIVREAGGNNTALVMTASHVADFYEPDKNDKLRIRLPESDQEFEGEVLHQDSYKDLALIAVSGMPDGYPALRFSREKDLPVGTDTVILAYYTTENLAGSKNPIPKKPGACPGRIVGPPIRDTDEVDWRERIRHDCKSMSGCSGGPIMVNGRVVGVLLCGDEQTAHAASFVTVEAIVKEWAGRDEEGGDLNPRGLVQPFLNVPKKNLCCYQMVSLV